MKFKELSKKLQESEVMVEKLTANDGMDKWITDFQQSDAPQFKGKNAAERRQMAIAAKLAADKAAGVAEETVSEGSLEEVELDEAKIDKSNPIVKEYDAMKKLDIKTLRGMVKGQHRIVDTSELHTKDHAISSYLRAKYGNKKVDQAFGFSEETVAEAKDPSAKIAALEKKIDAKQGSLEMTREKRRMSGKSKGVQGEREIKLSAEISKLRQELHMLKQGVSEEVIDEAITVDHDRYLRSHGKKASGTGNWMFTHKRSGDVDYNNDSEVHQARGSFSDASKSAKAWAKSKGHSTVYVMEEVKIDEASEHILEAEDKSVTRLKQLVRLGLMDKSKLSVLTRALKSLDSGTVNNVAERTALFELLNELIGIVTGDDTMFNKVRMNVQKEAMDPVDKKELKKDYKDREDKDIDNDGDTDKSDEYLHNRRKTISKNIKKGGDDVKVVSDPKVKDSSVSEAKAPDYTIHHKSYSSAVQHAVDHTNKHSGLTVDSDDYDRKVAMGPRKPSEGKTNEFHLTLKDKDGKESKKKLHMQVYGMGNGNYELNKYVS